MTPKNLCPLCGEGHLTPQTEEMVTEYEGQTGTVTLNRPGFRGGPVV